MQSDLQKKKKKIELYIELHDIAFFISKIKTEFSSSILLCIFFCEY